MNRNIERWLFELFSKTMSHKARGKATILTFHRVSDSKSIFKQGELEIREFREKVRLLKRHFNIVSIDELLNAESEKELPPYTVVLTVDDGYEDCYSVITPIFDEFKVPGSFFITTEGIEQGGLWNDKIGNAIINTQKDEIIVSGKKLFIGDEISKTKVLEDCLTKCKYLTLQQRGQFINELNEACRTSFDQHDFLSEDQIRAMANAGMTIGAHTHSHPILAVEDDEVSYSEIKRSKDILEGIIGSPISHFAYPNGMIDRDFDNRHEKMLEELGFKSGFSTSWGHYSNNTNRYCIPRFTPWDKNEYHFAYRLVGHSCKNYG